VQIVRRWRVRPEDLDAFVERGSPKPADRQPDGDSPHRRPSVWDLALQARSRIPPEDLARIPTDAVENLDRYLYGRPEPDKP